MGGPVPDHRYSHLVRLSVYFFPIRRRHARPGIRIDPRDQVPETKEISTPMTTSSALRRPGLAAIGALALLSFLIATTPAQAKFSAIGLCKIKKGPDKGLVRLVGANAKCKKGEKKILVVS